MGRTNTDRPGAVTLQFNLSVGSMSVTVVYESVPKINTMHCVCKNKTDRFNTLCGRFFWFVFHINHPSLASALPLDRNFSRRGGFYQIFPCRALSKNRKKIVSAYVFTRLLHRPQHLRVAYCKSNNYQRNGNMAVPGLFIYSGGKQAGNYLGWRSRKKSLIP